MKPQATHSSFLTIYAMKRPTRVRIAESQQDRKSYGIVDEITIRQPQAPAKLTDTRAPLEKQLFHLQALLIGWKEEIGSSGSSGGTSVPDHDFHIVIADPANTKTRMIIEVPDPACEGVCSSEFLDKIKTARIAGSGKLGQPTFSVVPLQKPWLIEVTGPALFDFSHGQDGLAKNCIEIHPVLEIKFLQEKANGPVHVNTKRDALPHNCGQK